MKNLALLIFLAILIFSCGKSQENSSNNTSEAEISLDSLKSQVLAIHDEVMPKMGELRKTRMALENLADSLMEVDSTKAATASQLAASISEANEGMMEWMRGYEPEFEGTDDEIRQYLEAQKKSIQQVKENMNSSLAQGKEALGSR